MSIKVRLIKDNRVPNSEYALISKMRLTTSEYGNT